MSDQALDLLKKSILPSIPLSGQSSANKGHEPSNSGTSKNRLLKKKPENIVKVSCSNPENPTDEKVLLHGPVLLNSQESTLVDSLMLTVPLAIASLPSPGTTASNSKPKTQKSKSSGSSGSGGSSSEKQEDHISIAPAKFEFEHSFPSSVELAADEKVAQQARVHLIRSLNVKLGPETKARFRDPHLLLYLQNLLDANSFNNLCR